MHAPSLYTNALWLMADDGGGAGEYKFSHRVAIR